MSKAKGPRIGPVGNEPKMPNKPEAPSGGNGLMPAGANAAMPAPAQAMAPPVASNTLAGATGYLKGTKI